MTLDNSILSGVMTLDNSILSGVMTLDNSILSGVMTLTTKSYNYESINFFCKTIKFLLI
jgi:hypothetical protein